MKKKYYLLTALMLVSLFVVAGVHNVMNLSSVSNYDDYLEQGIDEYLSSMVDVSQEAWHAWSVCATNFAPAVTTEDGREAQMMEKYEETTASVGEVMYQTISGLENGNYAVELYANALYTDGRGFASNLSDGATDVVYISANGRRQYVTAHIGTSVTENGLYTIYAPVTDGTLRLAMTAEKAGTNWHTIQIKSLRIIRNGTVVYAKDTTRTAGSANPEFDYWVSSQSITGIPALSCAATESSAIGSYVISVQQGTIESSSPLYFSNGVLTISGKYPDWQSDNHDDNSTSSNSWTIELTDASKLSFDWSVSSESSYDYLRVYLDDIVIIERSGEESGHFSRRIIAGSHTLRATYSKDGSGNNGSDQAKVFNINILGNEYDEIVADSIVTRSDVELVFQNGGSHGWYHSEKSARNANCGDSYSTALLSMSYQSEYKTELTFDWRCNNYSNHSLQLYIDGAYKGYVSNSSYESRRFYIDAGSHVILFRDSIGNSTSTNNYSYIKNLKIKEITPLETALLTVNSQPLTFLNGSAWPWTIEDGYIQNTNYDNANSGSRFSTSFTIDKTSKFSFNSNVRTYNGSSYTTSTSYSSNYHYFKFLVNGQSYMGTSVGSNETIIALEPGEYTVEWIDTIYNKYNSNYKYYSQVSNVELSNNWIDVETVTAGSLGVEVLYKANVLQDVEMLKVTGPLNATDWEDLRKMTNIVALDLSGARIDALPDNAFSGLSLLSSVILPEGMKTIGQSAFEGTQIYKIVIPSTVVTIGSSAFQNTRITEVTVQDGSALRYINSSAFYGCSSLQKIEFTSEAPLASIGGSAFYNCSSLQEFLMPNTVSSVGDYAFYGCSSLKSLWFSNALTYIGQQTCYNCSKLENLHLPDNVNTIYYRAFYGTSKLRHLELPQSLNTIRYQAFYGCGVDSVLLPTTLRYLSNEAFSSCGNLKYIELPSYLEYSSYSDTEGSSSYSSYTRYYGYYSNFTNCGSIQTVVCKSATPPSISSDPFSNSRAKSAITLKVPSFSVVNYKLDSYWYQFGTIQEGDDFDYWLVSGPLSLTNNRRMNGIPDIDLYYGGQLTVGGNAPMEVGQLNFYVSESNPCRLLNTCEAMTADDINTYYSVSSETWYFFTPLHDVDLSNVKVSNNVSYVFRYYDGASRAANGTGNSWRNVDNGKLEAGKGYIFRCNANAVLTMPAGYGQIFNPIAPMADIIAWEAQVCHTLQNGLGWTTKSFDDSSWETQQAAWGTPDIYPNINNDWAEDNSDIYIRRIVNLTADDLQKDLWVKYSHDDAFELYINGTAVINTGNTWKQGEMHRLTSSEKRNLVVGENLFSAHCHNGSGGAIIDFGLYERTFEGNDNGYDKVLNTADVTTTLTAYESTYDSNKSWNYVGNPYPCYYDIYYMDFTAPITVWTGSTYKAYSIVDDNFALRPMQSFFVQKPDAVDEIVFHKEGRQLTSSINHLSAARTFRAPALNARCFFDLQIIGDEMTDETRVVINNEASANYEIERDASKFMSFETTVPQLFTIDSDANGYAINERPLADGNVKLGYYVGQSGFYTISAIRADGDVYLYDAEKNKTVNLNEQDYTFYSDATNGTNTTRFILSLTVNDSEITGIETIDNSQLTIDNKVYDLQGRKILPSAMKGLYIQNGRKVVK